MFTPIFLFNIPNTYRKLFGNILRIFQRCFKLFNDTTYSFLKFIKITFMLISLIFFLHFLITRIISKNFFKIISQVSKVLKINYKFLQMFQKLISLLAIMFFIFPKINPIIFWKLFQIFLTFFRFVCQYSQHFYNFLEIIITEFSLRTAYSKNFSEIFKIVYTNFWKNFVAIVRNIL